MKNKLFEVVCVTLSVLLIVLSANIFTDYLHNKADQTQNQILKHILSIDVTQTNISAVSSNRVIDLAGKYFTSFIDYTIETQEIQKINTKAFSAIYFSLPAMVSVVSFDFDENFLCMVCSCENEEDYYELQKKLGDNDIFSKVEFSGIQKSDGFLSFTVNMYP